MPISAKLAPLVPRPLPILSWIPAYRHEWLVPDVFAGLALWAVMVPEAMAYAGIVGGPPIMGLDAIAPAFIAYAVLGCSRHRVVGPVPPTGVISALAVAAV